MKGNTVTLAVDGSKLLEWEDPQPLEHGCAGVAVQRGSHCLYKDWKIRSCEEL